ncbi:MAG: toxin-antitoxin system HicB family antitoxin [Candidatus Kapaibacterium sp.]
MKKDLEYYMNLDYDINIHKFSEEEGGGYEASIPQLGRHSFLGVGDTIEEAIDDLNDMKEFLFEKILSEGKEIPDPTPKEEELEDFDKYSGKFMVRVPKELHQILSESARDNGVSLNSYINYLLSRNSAIDVKAGYSGNYKNKSAVAEKNREYDPNK